MRRIIFDAKVRDGKLTEEQAVAEMARLGFNRDGTDLRVVVERVAPVIQPAAQVFQLPQKLGRPTDLSPRAQRLTPTTRPHLTGRRPLPQLTSSTDSLPDEARAHP
jgi:hypothetical protein